VVASSRGLTKQGFFHRSISDTSLIDSRVGDAADFAALDLAIQSGGRQFENCSISARHPLAGSSLATPTRAG
jgi:hypothetical protein